MIALNVNNYRKRVFFKANLNVICVFIFHKNVDLYLFNFFYLKNFHIKNI
jgi:hypothetical protein